MKPLLVGEVNPYNVDPQWALWPSPVNSSGWRLCKKILGMSKQSYIRSFERVNLCLGFWSIKNAKEQARLLQKEFDGPMVLLGSKVCEAFGVAYQPFAVQTSFLGADREILILPHPSGKCFAWNDPSAAERARSLVQQMLERSR